jgi:hypothetical protein
LRAFVGAAAVGLLLMTGLPLPGQWVHAQNLAQAKKKTAPKQAGRDEKKKDAEERPPFTVEEQAAAMVPGIADARVWGDSEQDFRRVLPQAGGPWLAVSGGGSDGAYGGGVLAGWSESGARPEFAVVTGASIGALIAPFAFLGPRYDDEIRKNFTTIGAADIFEDRATRDSLFDYWPLQRVIEQRVGPKLLSEIASEHSRGRRLLIATTNLDAGRPVVWNMGAIAAGGDERALKLFRDVLLASSSIPGFFSPVPITVEANGKRFAEMHGDGTLTAPFFVVPQSMLSARPSIPPPLDQVYLIVNSKLGPEFKMPERNVPGVLGRSIAVALTAALQAEVALLAVGAQRHGVALHLAHVDDRFDHPSRGPFDGQYMKALYEFGAAAGKKGTAFQEVRPDVSLRGSTAQ